MTRSLPIISPKLRQVVVANGRLDFRSGPDWRVFPNDYALGTEEERLHELTVNFFQPLFSASTNITLNKAKASEADLLHAGIRVLQSARSELQVQVDKTECAEPAVRFMCEFDREWGGRGMVRIVTKWDERLLQQVLSCLYDPSFTVNLRTAYSRTFIDNGVSIAASGPSLLVVEILGYGLNTISFFAHPSLREDLLTKAFTFCRFTPPRRQSNR